MRYEILNVIISRLCTQLETLTEAQFVGDIEDESGVTENQTTTHLSAQVHID